LLDLKTWDPLEHRTLTGIENGAVLEFAKRLSRNKKPIWVRFVLVPGITDAPSNIAAIAEFAGGLGNVERVDVLPFHQLGRFKWQKLGLKYTLETVATPSLESVNHACMQFRSVGLPAH
jgi:pyruvate formate lyase activating enzyme